jgi:uncharacterized sulfatase
MNKDGSIMEKELNRRSFIRKSIFTGAALAGVSLIGTCSYNFLKENSIDDLYGEYPKDAEKSRLRVTDKNAPRPNVIIIYCDDLGYGDLGCYGASAIRTPNVDRLANDGVRFTDYYACSAVCAPSRAGLLTGRYPFRTGVIGNPYPKGEPIGKRLARRFGVIIKGAGIMDIREDYVARGISSHEITIAEAMKAAGYKTGMIGKWHLGDYSTQPEFNPRKHGFDSYFGVPHSNDMVPCPLYRDEKELEADIGTNQARLTGMYTTEAKRFIESSNGSPFFLYLAHTFPHQPIYASKEFEKKSNAGIFGDAVEEIDWSLGEIVQHLRNKKLLDNTIIIFTSDNGPWYEGSAGGLRGRKGESNDGGYRVPFIVSWPKAIPGGRVVRQPAMNLDLFPTLISLAGVEHPRDRIIDGRNILGNLTGKDNKPPHERIFFYHYDLLEGVRAGKWKYYRSINRYNWPIPLDTAGFPNMLGSKKQLGVRSPLLYDLESDPGESYNLINTRPDIAAKLLAIMEEWEVQTKKNPRGFLPK